MANLNIRGTFRVEIESVTKEMKDHADKLGKALRRRLLKHIRTKIDDRTKHNHPALLFVRYNINRFCALLVYFKQSSNRIIANSSLLQHPSRGGFIEASNEELEGSYWPKVSVTYPGDFLESVCRSCYGERTGP